MNNEAIHNFYKGYEKRDFSGDWGQATLLGSFRRSAARTAWGISRSYVTEIKYPIFSGEEAKQSPSHRIPPKSKLYA